MEKHRISCCVLIKYVHLRGFGFVLPIEELWQGSAFNGMNTGGKEVLMRTHRSNTSELLQHFWLFDTCHVPSRAETTVDFHFHLNWLLGVSFFLLFTSLESDYCQCFFPLPVVIEPGSVARYNNVMSLLRHIVLVKVRAFHRFTLHTRRAFLLLLFQHKHTLKMTFGFAVLTVVISCTFTNCLTLPVVSMDSSSCSSDEITKEW